MKPFQIMTAGLLLAGAAGVSQAQANAQANAQAKVQAPATGGAMSSAGLSRTDVVRHDLDARREAIQVRVDFDGGASAPMHKHPGAEVAYVLEGAVEYKLGDQPPVTLKAGDALFIPAGVYHSARNTGAGKASELATYVVEKGQPLVVLQH